MRVGYVGLGWATRAFHVPASARVDGAVAVGGADLSEEQRASWVGETKLPAYATLEELVERERPEVVVVATPPDSHESLCLSAIDAGVHVLCEKPFVSSVEAADRVIRGAESAGVRIAVNHEFREKPIFQALTSRIGTRELGELVFCQIWQLMDLAPWDEPVPWRAAMPDRSLFEGGVHLVDLLVTFFGELPSGVYARRSSGLDGTKDADAIHLVTLDFPGGRLGQITINRLCRAGTRYVEVRADCEHASLRASHGGRATLQIGKKRAERSGLRIDFGPGGLAWMEQGERRKTLARNPRDDGVVGTARLTEKFLAAIAADRDPPSSAREARDVLRVIEAAYRSAATGERVELT